MIATLFFMSCGSGDAANTKTAGTTAPVTTIQDNNYIAPVGVDAKVSTSLKPVFDAYLQIKNALAADNGRDAANAGEALTTALSDVDTAAMTAPQKTTYHEIIEDMREHADHMAKNAGKIEHQRQHFKMLSDDTYELAKTFGGGRKLYYTHCPMAFDNKGASWVSEFEEIKNPYFGDQMLECGEVKEELK